jgi:hypothetical protein
MEMSMLGTKRWLVNTFEPEDDGICMGLVMNYTLPGLILGQIADKVLFEKRWGKGVGRAQPLSRWCWRASEDRVSDCVVTTRSEYQIISPSGKNNQGEGGKDYAKRMWFSL